MTRTGFVQGPLPTPARQKMSTEMQSESGASEMSNRQIEQQRIMSTKAAEADNVGLRHLCIELADVILENKRGTVQEESTLYDRSTRGKRSSEPFDLSLYQTVGDFLDNEYTGETIPTFISGHGFAGETYEDVFFEKMFDASRILLQQLIDQHLLQNIEMEDAQELFAEEGEINMMELFRSLPLQETFFRHLQPALAQRHQRGLEQLARQRATEEKEKHRHQLANHALIFKINAYSTSKIDASQAKRFFHFLNELEKTYGNDVLRASLSFATLEMSIKVRHLFDAKYQF